MIKFLTNGPMGKQWCSTAGTVWRSRYLRDYGHVRVNQWPKMCSTCLPMSSFVKN